MNICLNYRQVGSRIEDGHDDGDFDNYRKSEGVSSTWLTRGSELPEHLWLQKSLILLCNRIQTGGMRIRQSCKAEKMADTFLRIIEMLERTFVPCFDNTSTRPGSPAVPKR